MTRTLKERFLANIVGFRASLCVTLEGPALPEPEQVVSLAPVDSDLALHSLVDISSRLPSNARRTFDAYVEARFNVSVFGELEVFKTKYRLDMFPEGEAEEGEGDEIISRIRGRDFKDAEENTFHTDRYGTSLKIEDYFTLEERKGAKSPKVALPHQCPIRECSLCHPCHISRFRNFWF
eukprot:8336346-Pyramimonas_sp.AAC.1